MTLIPTAKFPRRSIRKGKIRGAEALALARSGKAYCIDRYEYPGAGSTPRTRVSMTAAEGLCKSRKKRLCSDREWRKACRGRGGAAFPYGRTFNPNKCNTEDADEEERSITASGRFRGCRSAWGVYDMSGNVAEWTGGQTVRGGDSSASDEEAACSAGGRSAPSTARSSIGFRCCSDFTQ